MGLFRRSKPAAKPTGTLAPAYRPASWPEVQCHRRTLERLARWVENGNDAEFSEYHEKGLADFGKASPHFQAAARGNYDAGMEYHKSVAGGKFWILD